MTNRFITSSVFFIVTLFSCSVYAKLNFALTCIGSGVSMVLVAEHEKDSERVLKDVDEWTVATLTTTKPSFNRNELLLAKEDEKQFFYAEHKDWLDLSRDKENFYFLDRDTLKLTKYSKSPKRFGNAKLIGTYSCKLSPNAAESNSQVEMLFKKKLEEKDAEKQRQLKRNKV
jgi:hypothetical protein